MDVKEMNEIKIPKRPEFMKVKDITHCDICGVKSDHLSDQYAMLCQNCLHKNYDINLLRIIGQLQTQIDILKGESVLK